MTVEIRGGIAKMGRIVFKITNQNGKVVDNGSHIYRRDIWLETNMVRCTIVKGVHNKTEGTQWSSLQRG